MESGTINANIEEVEATLAVTGPKLSFVTKFFPMKKNQDLNTGLRVEKTGRHSSRN